MWCLGRPSVSHSDRQSGRHQTPPRDRGQHADSHALLLRPSMPSRTDVFQPAGSSSSAPLGRHARCRQRLNRLNAWVVGLDPGRPPSPHITRQGGRGSRGRRCHGLSACLLLFSRYPGMVQLREFAEFREVREKLLQNKTKVKKK